MYCSSCIVGTQLVLGYRPLQVLQQRSPAMQLRAQVWSVMYEHDHEFCEGCVQGSSRLYLTRAGPQLVVLAGKNLRPVVLQGYALKMWTRAHAAWRMEVEQAKANQTITEDGCVEVYPGMSDTDCTEERSSGWGTATWRAAQRRRGGYRVNPGRETLTQSSLRKLGGGPRMRGLETGVT